MVGVPLTGLSVGFGYRMMNLGVFGEAQFVQGPLGGELFDLNAQLRAYLPLAGQLELFPMVSLGASHLMQAERSDHLDIGVGAQLNLAPFMAVGARYQARVIGGQNNMSSPNGHQLTAQLSFSF